MPSSDSENFESADEGHETPDKKERKKRLSSSSNSGNVLEIKQQSWGIKLAASKDQTSAKCEKVVDGWDDFDIEDNDTVEPKVTKEQLEPYNRNNASSNVCIQNNEKTTDTGWDDFDNWGQDEQIYSGQKEEPQNVVAKAQPPEPDIKAVTDKLAAVSTSGSWGWGWSVDSLLSTATAGISTITSQVSQGISTVLETSIGAPDPEELARKTSKDESSNKRLDDTTDVDKKSDKAEIPEPKGSGDTFQFGGLLSGVTKFVETTGTKVISGGLDTLETIGKKTMEVLQDGDPGFAKKRALLGLSDEKPVLSQVLREAKCKADEEDRIREEKREAKEVHYENLFDDFEGLVHLEALEMLSKQVSMRIEERLRSVDAAKRQDIRETLQQVAELCEMPEEDEDEEDSLCEELPKAEAFRERLQTATRDLGLKLQFQPLVERYADILEWLSASDSSVTGRMIYKGAVSGLAQSTALSVELYHRAAEMLLVSARRSTADEADALTQLTVVLTKHISELAALFTEKMNAINLDNTEQINGYITNIFLEAGNSSTYIQNAFQLALPVLQIGAV